MVANVFLAFKVLIEVYVARIYFSKIVFLLLTTFEFHKLSFRLLKLFLMQVVTEGSVAGCFPVNRTSGAWLKDCPSHCQSTDLTF